MKKMNLKMSALALSIAFNANPVFASDAASNAVVIEWLKTLANDTKEALKTAHDTLSVENHLKELEELRFAKDVGGTGRELQALAGDFRDVIKMYERVSKHPYNQINSIKSEMETLRRKAGKLGEGDAINELDDFGALLARADRSAIIREALRRADQERMKGLSETHAIRGTEANTALMTEILLGQEEARLVKEAKEAKQREAMKNVRINTAPAFGRLSQ